MTIDAGGRPTPEMALGLESRLTSERLKEMILGAQVVAATCLTAGASTLLAAHKRFDACVVDEAGQLSQPDVLGALFLSRHAAARRQPF